MVDKINDVEAAIASLPLWRGALRIEPLSGGLTNKNYRVSDAAKATVVRIGGDIPVHGVMRFNEAAASRAASEAGVSPKLLYAAPGVLVIDFIDGKSLSPAEVRADRERCVALTKRVHRELPRFLRGPTLAFNVFHVIRDYAHRLIEDGGRFAGRAEGFAADADRLERLVGPSECVFGHNDLLAANFLDDGKRLWLVDWDYAGWGSPLFDLGGLSSNSGFSGAESDAMLEQYFEAPVTDRMRGKFDAMLCASLLRESMWSMVSEVHSTIDFDYVAYTNDNLTRFEQALTRLDATERR